MGVLDTAIEPETDNDVFHFKDSHILLSFLFEAAGIDFGYRVQSIVRGSWSLSSFAFTLPLA